jgi:hypothetical protein
MSSSSPLDLSAGFGADPVAVAELVSGGCCIPVEERTLYPSRRAEIPDATVNAAQIVGTERESPTKMNTQD